MTSHYPFVLQEFLGIAEPRDTSKRVPRPTAATPATFEANNWDYCENGPSSPQPQEGVITFMGPATTASAGMGKSWPEDQALPFRAALKILRKEGMTCQVPPDDYEFEDEEEEIEDRELEYLKEEYYTDLEVKKDNHTQVVMRVVHGWLYLRCSNEQVAALVEEKFKSCFALAKIEHKEETIMEEDGYTIVQRTGNEVLKSAKTALSTLFSLKKGNKVIAKALCTYSNFHMEAAGPTIEQIETAAEWQGRGHGTRLLEAIEEYYENMFENVIEVSNVKFNVCYVTNSKASRWFQYNGFQDWDGMGEELGKYLGDEEY